MVKVIDLETQEEKKFEFVEDALKYAEEEHNRTKHIFEVYRCRIEKVKRFG